MVPDNLAVSLNNSAIASVDQSGVDTDSPASQSGSEEQEDHTLPAADSNEHVHTPVLNQSRPRKSAAWADPDDQNIQVSLTSDKRLRKLRDAPQEDAIGGRDYEARLRRQ